MSNISKIEKSKVIYTGVDKLEIVFNCYVSQKTLSLLEEAKTVSQEEERLSKTVLNGLPVKVYPTGRAGGFAFQFDTGVDGEVWAVKNSKKLGWNVSVSIKSSSLAQYGYETVKERLQNRLKKFNIDVIEESIGRFDFCVDFLAPDFQLDPLAFSKHSNCKHLSHADGESYSIQGRRFNAVTIGSMPFKQIQVYDKTLEVNKKGKTEWWEIWGLDKEDKKNKVWRVEFRAGKRHLKDDWDIRSFKDLEEKAGDMFTQLLSDIRMLDTSTDQANITRVKTHSFWKTCLEKIHNVFEVFGHAKVNVVATTREKTKGIYSKMICGIASSYSYVKGFEIDEIDKLKEALFEEISDFLHYNQKHYRKTYQKAEERLLFVEEV